MKTKMNKYKNKIGRIFTLLIFCIALQIQVLGQITPVENANEIAARAQIGIRARYVDLPTPGTGKVMLHWAPMNLANWNLGKTNGYKISRYLLDINNLPTGVPVVFIVQKKPNIDPTVWALKKNENYYDMVYDALYEPGLPNPVDNKYYKDAATINNGGKPDSLQINNSTDELSFNFAMFAASVSYGAATWAGLTYEDNTIVKGNKYRYVIVPRTSLNDNARSSAKVKAAVPAIVEGIGKVDIETATQGSYPIIKNPDIKYDKNNATKIELRWPYKYSVTDTSKIALSKYFAAFHIERKSNIETTYRRITETPIVKFSQLSDSLFHIDSIANRKLSYTYRLVGISYFDEEQFSIETTITTAQTHNKVPAIKYFKNTNITNYTIDWRISNLSTGGDATFPADSILRYEVWVANKDEPTSYKLLSSSLPKTAFTSTLPKTLFALPLIDSTKSMYFQLKLITIDEDVIESLPFLFLARKKVGPAKPTGLAASFESEVGGIYTIKIKWNKITVNNEPLKYQLFRRIGDDIERYDISNGISVIDQVLDKYPSNISLPRFTYYLIAYDDNFMPSEEATVPFQKTDKFAPFAPTIKSFSVDNLDVTLNFELSLDKDIKSFYVRRRKVGDPDTLSFQIAEFNLSNIQKSILDKNLENGSTYIYWIYAEDNIGNFSCYNKAQNNCFQLVPIKVLNSKKNPIAGFNSNLNNEITSYVLYKNISDRNAPINSSLLSFWKTITPYDLTLTDFDVKYFATYQYGIKAVYKDGTTSPMSTSSVFIPNKEGCISGNLVIVNETELPANTIKTDTSCFEIKLKPGFSAKASNGVQYKGEIKGN
jgi:uncharacterized protein